MEYGRGAKFVEKSSKPPKIVAETGPDNKGWWVKLPKEKENAYIRM